MDSSDLRPFLEELADAAAAAILPRFRTSFAVESKEKDGFDPVTAADREAETAIRRLIASRYPDHGVIGEEFPPERPGAEHVWVVDPIDGTRAFIAGIPVWGTLIGLLSRGTPTLGMMAQPFTGERFSGDGSAAWYTGPRGAHVLKTRACTNIASATLSTTTPFLFDGVEMPAYRRVESAARMVRYGCDCYAYAMLAAGFIDIVVEAGLKPYDIVALIPVIEGAGGKVTTWDGGPAAGGGRVVATGDPRLHDTVLQMLRV